MFYGEGFWDSSLPRAHRQDSHSFNGQWRVVCDVGLSGVSLSSTKAFILPCGDTGGSVYLSDLINTLEIRLDGSKINGENEAFC